MSTTATRPDQRPGTRLAESADHLVSASDDPALPTMASAFVDDYRDATDEERVGFFQLLLEEFGADETALAQAIDDYATEPDSRTLQRLGNSAEPRRQSLVRALNTAKGGTSELLRMRADILEAQKTQPQLAPVNADFAHVLGSWFNLGFLHLEQLDWDTPASALERLIEFEAVHEIRSWSDLRRRLAPDRRCFAFFHPALPTEPVIFVEVALTNSLSASIQGILDEPPPEDQETFSPDTAIFYSITNCQPGLKGVAFGASLLKSVMEMLEEGFPLITTFSTLSPLPGFMRWLRTCRDERTLPWLDDAQYRLLKGLDDSSWTDYPYVSESLEPILLRAADEYLGSTREDGLPLDPVARFHLGNGATLKRINWLGDTSQKGLAESAGLLVNYLYVGDDAEDAPNETHE